MNLNQILGVLFAALLVFSGVATPASAAADDCGILSDLFGQCDDANDDGFIATTLSAASGALDRVKYTVLGGDDDLTAQKQADAVAQTFNTNNATLIDYANKRFTATDDYDVIRFEFVDEDGDKASKYLVSTVVDGDVTSAEMVDSTDRKIDSYVSIEGLAFEEANSELKHFVVNYAEEDKTPKRSYLANKYTKYKGDLDGTLLRGLTR